MTSAIARIEAFAIDIPMHGPLATSRHRYDQSRFAIVRATAADGTQGLG